jgi:hypothetical protein
MQELFKNDSLNAPEKLKYQALPVNKLFLTND